jgi:hypothetical protein
VSEKVLLVENICMDKTLHFAFKYPMFQRQKLQGSYELIQPYFDIPSQSIIRQQCFAAIMSHVFIEKLLF